jgi:hypothetical protein
MGNVVDPLKNKEPMLDLDTQTIIVHGTVSRNSGASHKYRHKR